MSGKHRASYWHESWKRGKKTHDPGREKPRDNRTQNNATFTPAGHEAQDKAELSKKALFSRQAAELRGVRYGVLLHQLRFRLRAFPLCGSTPYFVF
jgi:hypothetical protein